MTIRGLTVVWVGAESTEAADFLERETPTLRTAEAPFLAGLLQISNVGALIVDVESCPAETLAYLRSEAGTHAARHVPLLEILPEGESRTIRSSVEVLADRSTLSRPLALPDLERWLDDSQRHPFAPRGGLEGELGGETLLTVLRSLEHERGTGRISVRTANRAGGVEIRDGAFVGAELGSLVDRDALFEMLSLEAGRYAFEGTVPGSRDPQATGSMVALRYFLSEARLLTEELEDQRSRLPGPKVGLRAIAPLTEGHRPDLSLEEIHSRIRVLPGITLERLVQLEVVSRVRLELGIVTMVKDGIVAGQARFDS